jgi:hypothetical protein
MNEVKFTGNEVIQDDNETYDCKAELVMKGETNIPLNSPQYQGQITPLLESMSPRFGSVVGGADVTFSG